MKCFGRGFNNESLAESYSCASRAKVPIPAQVVQAGFLEL